MIYLEDEGWWNGDHDIYTWPIAMDEWGARIECHGKTEEQAKQLAKSVLRGLHTKLKDGDKNWKTPCQNCGELPTVYPTDLCGPCCFGEADTYGGNW